LRLNRRAPTCLNAPAARVIVTARGFVPQQRKEHIACVRLASWRSAESALKLLNYVTAYPVLHRNAKVKSGGKVLSFTHSDAASDGFDLKSFSELLWLCQSPLCAFVARLRESRHLGKCTHIVAEGNGPVYGSGVSRGDGENVRI
jgi:hypothetical protein